MLRVVIDTSTLISYVLTAGEITSRIIAGWRAEELVVLSTPQTRQELRRVLESPRILRRTQSPLTRLADDMERFSLRIAGSLQLTGICRDPKDDIFLACAVEGQADYLISSDRDLLDLVRYQEVCILNPGEFLVAWQLARLPLEAIREQYSHSALATIQATLCLDVNTLSKLSSL